MDQNIGSEAAELVMTVKITRKETGAVEEYTLRSLATPEQAAAVQEMLPAHDTEAT